MQRLEGVLLDVDGTLIDSNDAHAHSWVKALAEQGIDVPFQRVRRLIGKGGDKLLPEVSGIDPESPRGKKVSERRGEIFVDEWLPKLRPFSGVEPLLARMKEQGLRLAVASSAKKKELGKLLHACGADQFVEAQTSSDDAANSKPDPDVIHAALQSIKLPAAQVILLGDTPYDVEAGRRACVTVVAVRCGGWSDADLAGAIAIYADPADLLAHFDSSLFDRR